MSVKETQGKFQCFLWCQFKDSKLFPFEASLVQDMTLMSDELLNSQSTMVEAELTLPMIAKEQVVSCSLDLLGRSRCESATPLARQMWANPVDAKVSADSQRTRATPKKFDLIASSMDWLSQMMRSADFFCQTWSILVGENGYPGRWVSSSSLLEG